MATQRVSRELMEDGVVFHAPKHDLRARFHELGEFQWQDRYIACIIRDVVPNAETTSDYDWVVSFCYWQYKWAHASICDQKHVDTAEQRAAFNVAKRVLIVDPLAAEKHRAFCNSHP